MYFPDSAQTSVQQSRSLCFPYFPALSHYTRCNTSAARLSAVELDDEVDAAEALALELDGDVIEANAAGNEGRRGAVAVVVLVQGAYLRDRGYGVAAEGARDRLLLADEASLLLDALALDESVAGYAGADDHVVALGQAEAYRHGGEEAEQEQRSRGHCDRLKWVSLLGEKERSRAV